MTETNGTTMTVAEQQLDNVAAAMMVWKPSAMRTVAGRIVEHALRLNGAGFFPEEIDTSDLDAGDMNCVGVAYRLLADNGIVSRTGRWRSSRAGAAKGRTVFAWALASARLARAWQKANGLTVTEPVLKQAELGL